MSTKVRGGWEGGEVKGTHFGSVKNGIMEFVAKINEKIMNRILIFISNLL